MLQNNEQIIEQIAKIVEKRLKNEGSGHDWWHIYRVWNLAKRICKIEGGNYLIVELSSLLHDIADWKEFNGDTAVGPIEASKILNDLSVDGNLIDDISEIIATMSFKGSAENDEMATLEGKIVQDADRLDALGAIGIARVFAYGGYKKQLLYDPEVKHAKNQTKKQFLEPNGTSINHFYEKLLLLKDRMKTETAKKIANERHIYMEQYLDRFYKEWEGIF